MSQAGSGLRFFRIAQQYRSLQAIIFGAIGGTILNFTDAGNRFITALFNVLILPLVAFGQGLADNVTALIGGYAAIIGQGVETTVLSIAPGAAFAVGPLTIIISILTVGAATYTVAVVLAQAATSNFALGAVFDVPTPGFSGPEEDTDNED